MRKRQLTLYEYVVPSVHVPRVKVTSISTPSSKLSVDVEPLPDKTDRKTDRKTDQHKINTRQIGRSLDRSPQDQHHTNQCKINTRSIPDRP